MSSNQVRRIAVVDGQSRVVGLVSLGDFARSLSAKPAHGISLPTVARTLSEIVRRFGSCRPNFGTTRCVAMVNLPD